MKKADQDLLIDALERAKKVLAEHRRPGSPYSAAITINRLSDALDGPELAAAQERLKARRGLRVIK